MSVLATGRTAGSQAVSTLLAAATSRPRALVISGEAGIGKTTLWSAAIARARDAGFQVLWARAGEAESVLSYAAVADLLTPVGDDVFDRLPALQRLAVDRVLLRAGADGAVTDHQVTAAALLSIVRLLCERSPVLLAVDDVQWLDPSSRLALDLTCREVTGRVGILVTARAVRHDAAAAVPWLTLPPPGSVERMRLGAMSVGALQEMVRERLGRALPRATMSRIAEVAAGNPFYAMELARAIETGDGHDGALPATLADLVRLRTAHFGEPTLDVLLAAASVSDPTVSLLAQATGATVPQVVELLRAPLQEGIVEIDGDRVRFTHPLLSRGVYTQATPARRRRMHRTLAAVERHPELQARHLALGTASADANTLAVLDTAAETASARGASAAAAELVELAMGLGGDTPVRRLRAAGYRLRAGDAHGARDLVAPVLAGSGAGELRVPALVLAANGWMYDCEFDTAIELLHAARREVGDDPSTSAHVELGLALALGMQGAYAEALRHAEPAVAYAERVGAPALISQAVAMAVSLQCTLGKGCDEAALRRALDLEDPDADVPAQFRARAVRAVTQALEGRLEEARATLFEIRRSALERGSDADLLYAVGHLALTNNWLARFDEAGVVAEELLRRAERQGVYAVATARIQVALSLAHRGREAEAREQVAAGMAGAVQCGSRFVEHWHRYVRGFLEVSKGDYAAALAVLEPLVDGFDPSRGTEMYTNLFLPDAIEALVAVGRLDDAERLVAPLERNGAAMHRPWMAATGARGRAMLLAARGDLDAAADAVQAALAAHALLSMPFERARTELLCGQLARRRRRKQVAATVLGGAVAAFESMGAPLWAERARNELARVTVARGGESTLTPSEASVARLAAGGMSNRDIAAALFISPKTVEHNLSRVYRKLGVRARAELPAHERAWQA